MPSHVGNRRMVLDGLRTRRLNQRVPMRDSHDGRSREALGDNTAEPALEVRPIVSDVDSRDSETKATQPLRMPSGAAEARKNAKPREHPDEEVTVEAVEVDYTQRRLPRRLKVRCPRHERP